MEGTLRNVVVIKASAHFTLCWFLSLLHLSVVGLTGRSLVALVWIDTVVVILCDWRDTGFRQSEWNLKTKVALSGFTKWHYNHNIHNHDDQQDDDYDHKYDDDDDDRHDGDYEWPVGFAPWRPPLSDRCPPGIRLNPQVAVLWGWWWCGDGQLKIPHIPSHPKSPICLQCNVMKAHLRNSPIDNPEAEKHCLPLFVCIFKRDIKYDIYSKIFHQRFPTKVLKNSGGWCI